MTRQQELEAIDRYIAERGITRYPPAFSAPINIGLRRHTVDRLKLLLSRANRRRYEGNAHWWAGAAD